MYFYGTIAKAGDAQPYTTRAGKEGWMQQFVIKATHGGDELAITVFRDSHKDFLNGHMGEVVKVFVEWGVYWNDTRGKWHNNVRYTAIEYKGEEVK